jgi:L-ribulose-5-phosphate 4-epimerase
MKSPYQELKERAWVANMEIPARGLAIYTFGNVSALDRQRGVFAIKPSGVEYTKFAPADVVVVDLDGNVVEGSLRPSSDTRTHAVIYRAFEKVGGIVHTHSTYATGWAQTGMAIPIYGTTHADYVPDDIPCTRVMSPEAVERDYETETGEQILECFKGRSPLHTPMVLVAGHGPFAWGTTAEQAVYHAAMLEQIAQMAFITRGIHAAVGRLPEYLIRKHFERKHGPRATYGQRAAMASRPVRVDSREE